MENVVLGTKQKTNTKYSLFIFVLLKTMVCDPCY